MLTGIVFLLVMAAFRGVAPAAIGDSASKHNMTEIPGNGFTTVCQSCHEPHAASGEKRLWSKDKEQPGDRLRDLAPAKAESLDQAAGPGDYPGIYLCLDCHSNSSTAPNWTKAPGYTAAKVKTHSTREMQAAGYTTKRESFVVECTTCHDTHQRWTGTFNAGVNGYMVRPTIKTPNSGNKTVVFTSMTGANSLGSNLPAHTSVCEVCHTTTIYHKNTNSTAHNDGINCIGCHNHSNGFAGLGCQGCHGDPPTTFNTLVGRPANTGSTPTGSVTAGKHAYHTYSTNGGTGYQCTVCHRGGMGGGVSENKVIDVRFSAFGVSTSGGFDGFSPISGYTFSANNTSGGTLQCSNTYCHGNFTGGYTGNRPVWNVASTGACGTCHATAPPGLANHSLHLTSAWGPMAACDDCHPAGSVAGKHAGHVDGAVTFKDGNSLSATNACDRCHGSGTATAKSSWRNPTSLRGTTTWCETCHDGSSTVNTTSGTGGVDVSAPNVDGDGTYGFDWNGHGRPGIGLACTDCHDAQSAHIDGNSPSYRSTLNNYKAGYRLALANTVPLLGNYSSSGVKLCLSSCHIESRLLGMPPGGKQSGFHVRANPISTDKWYTNFRNMSTYAGLYEGNWDDTSAGDVPTNIHWNHMDDYGSNNRGQFFGTRIFDSDGDGVGDSNVTCETCHNPHGTKQPAMVLDDFSLKTFSVLTNQSINPSYRWLGSARYTTTRCTQVCHSSGNASGTAGTKWYREPTSLSTVFGIPLGLKAVPLP